MVRNVSDLDILPFIPLVESYAKQLQRYAEYDDLRQEGLIAVFMQLRIGEEVLAVRIRDRMRNWIRAQKRHQSVPEYVVHTG